MKFTELIKRDTRKCGDIIRVSANRVQRSYSPELGSDDNGKEENQVCDAVKNIVRYERKLEEVEFHA